MYCSINIILCCKNRITSMKMVNSLANGNNDKEHIIACLKKQYNELKQQENENENKYVRYIIEACFF